MSALLSGLSSILSANSGKKSSSLVLGAQWVFSAGIISVLSLINFSSSSIICEKSEECDPAAYSHFCYIKPTFTLPRNPYDLNDPKDTEVYTNYFRIMTILIIIQAVILLIPNFILSYVEKFTTNNINLIIQNMSKKSKYILGYTVGYIGVKIFSIALMSVLLGLITGYIGDDIKSFFKFTNIENFFHVSKVESIFPNLIQCDYRHFSSNGTVISCVNNCFLPSNPSFGYLQLLIFFGVIIFITLTIISIIVDLIMIIFKIPSVPKIQDRVKGYQLFYLMKHAPNIDKTVYDDFLNGKYLEPLMDKVTTLRPIQEYK